MQKNFFRIVFITFLLISNAVLSQHLITDWKAGVNLSSRRINNCIYIESIDSIKSKEYIFYIIKAQNQKSEPIKLMSYTKYNTTCSNDSKIKENNTYDLDVSTWFRTTYFNAFDCFVIDSIRFCRDSTYNDIYGVENLNGLCLGNR